MKNLILLITICFTTMLNAQWVAKDVDNGFDPVYEIAYSKGLGGNGMIKLEDFKEGVSFYFSDPNIYICGDNALIDISFKVNGEYQKFSTLVTTYDHSMIVFTDDLATSEYYNAFLSATEMKLRITDINCTGDQSIYTFSMSGSTNAFKKLSD